MSIIKDIYELAKEGAIIGAKITAIKRALRTELKLNAKFLKDIEKGNPVDVARRKDIINMLDITELSDTVRYDIPYALICRKKVSQEQVEAYKIKWFLGFDFEMLVESLYLKNLLPQKDLHNPNINLNLRLINIYKYNRILIELLS